MLFKAFLYFFPLRNQSQSNQALHNRCHSYLFSFRTFALTNLRLRRECELFVVFDAVSKVCPADIPSWRNEPSSVLRTVSFRVS